MRTTMLVCYYDQEKVNQVGGGKDGDMPGRTHGAGQQRSSRVKPSLKDKPYY
jgi:hypothetical protein